MIQRRPSSLSQGAGTGRLPRVLLMLLVSLAAVPALAQFKVIGADGKVTYTDREPSAAEGKVVPLGNSRAVAQPVEPELPFELRQVTGRYPVTLYVSTGACDPCNSARQMLKQRGIPFNERMVVTDEDSLALEKLSGAREAPTVTIGPQTLRGYAAETWSSYLDAAGYPRDSKLPASYQYRPATPVVERRDAGASRPVDPRGDARSSPAAPAATPAPTPGGIRF